MFTFTVGAALDRATLANMAGSFMDNDQPCKTHGSPLRPSGKTGPFGVAAGLNIKGLETLAGSKKHEARLNMLAESHIVRLPIRRTSQE